MIRSFAELREAARRGGAAGIAIAGGDTPGAVEFAFLAERENIASSIFVGERAAIEEAVAQAAQRPQNLRLHTCPADEAAAEAVKLCLAGEASFVMKGKVKTNELLRAALRTEEEEIREHGYFLSHTAVIENPRAGKLLQVTDGGMNVLPSLEEKILIMRNAVAVAHRLGIVKPKVILAAGMEDTGQDIPAIADAREIVRRHHAGEWPDAAIDGPFGVDIGLDAEAARAKGIDTPVAGDVDIVVVPNLESCNIAVKMVLYYTRSFMLGLVVGGAVPILLVSRGAPAEANLLSAALAKLVRQG